MLRSLLLLPILSALASPVHQIPFSALEGNQADEFTFKHLPPSDAMALLQHIKSLPEERRVRWMDEDGLHEVTITEGQKALLTANNIRFEDITDEQSTPFSFKPLTEIPATLAYSVKQLEPLFKTISTSRMREFLGKFTSFRTRYYRSEDGRKSQRFLLSHIQQLISRKPHLNYTVAEFPHAWGQSSIILHLERESNKHSPEDHIVILGAHQDSTNFLPFLNAPGADDDGSGTTTILEVLQVLLQADFVPQNSSIEFHWYSAEEGGLLGSQAVSQAYQGRSVKSMLQFDMTAYVKPGTEERVGIISDFVDPDLTDFIFKVASEYTTIKPVSTKCGYACSDHASWGKTGVRSSFAIEATFEDSNTGNIHTTNDKMTIPGFSFDHMAQFARIGIAYLKEMSA